VALLSQLGPRCWQGESTAIVGYGQPDTVGIEIQPYRDLLRLGVLLNIVQRFLGDAVNGQAHLFRNNYLFRSFY